MPALIELRAFPASGSRWHSPHDDSMYFAGRIGCSHASVLLCASATVVAAPCPRWHMVHPNWSSLCGMAGMRAEGLHVHVDEAGFFQTNVAARAAVDYAEFGQPDLLDPSLEVALQRDGIAAVANHL